MEKIQNKVKVKDLGQSDPEIQNSISNDPSTLKDFVMAQAELISIAKRSGIKPLVYYWVSILLAVLLGASLIVGSIYAVSFLILLIINIALRIWKTLF